jgi:hydroxypyruvate isomerase
VNCLAGISPPGADRDRVLATLEQNLKFAADKLEAAGIRLLIEPINDKDIPGFWLNHADQAVALIDQVGSRNVFVQYDLYHQQRMSGELAATFGRLKDRITHIQVADNPGRNEPGTGEINYPFLFDQLDRDGYTGWIGCEYKPKTTTSAGLGWAAAYLRRVSDVQQQGVGT